MTAFVLVHGAWHGGWCYAEVAKLLKDKGHIVYTPTLTGVSDRASEATPEVGLETHVADILSLLTKEDLKDIVLCGHSYGGMVIQQVADRARERIASLVFLDALVPENGQSAFDIRGQGFPLIEEPTGEPWRVPAVPTVVFGLKPEVAAVVDAHCSPMPVRCFEQKLKLNGPPSHPGRRIYVLADLFNPSPFTAVAERLSKNPDWKVLHLPAGHELMIELPEEVEEILLLAAKADA